ncbi:MAG: outer membrane beta-barrel protein [Flavisolibacter sp.]
MKKFYFLLFAIFAVMLTASAQKISGSVKGVLQDTTAQPLSDATISVMRVRDSSLISFTVSTRNGNFEIKNIEAGEYSLIASYTGLQTLRKKFQINSASQLMDFGVLQMGRNYKLMDEVVVTDDAPIKVKGDTLEFRADAFKSSKPNAMVEDLLKKIPGVEVDKEGGVKAQGEQVQKVYVDGKEFFGTDPKLATKNLSQDMVESVQVFDDMSEQSKFTKIDDGSRAKAINIKLKKDKKHGTFGKAMAGAGTNDRYDASLSVNRFNGSRQISMIGAANNLNKQGFTFSDVSSTMGMTSMGGGGFGGGGGRMVVGGGNSQGGSNSSGVISPRSLGFNYRDVWGSKVDVSGSVFGSQSSSLLLKTRLRNSSFSQNDSATIDDAYTANRSNNENLRVNFRMEYKIDSMNSLLYYPSLTLQQSEGNNIDSVTTYASTGKTDYYKRLTQKILSNNERDGFNMNQNLLFRHRFRKTGRTITFGVTSTMNQSNGDGSYYTPYRYYLPDGTEYYSKVVDQKTEQKIEGLNNTISTSYTEPLGRNKLLELNYAYTNNQTSSDRKAFDYDTASGKHDKINAPSTNYFENGYISHRAGMNFRVQQKKYNAQIGMGIQTNELTSRSVRATTGKDTTISQTFMNLYPTGNFNYNFTRNKSFRINYRGRTNQPGINQLQDVPDYSNPLQVKTGNPFLKQEFANSFNMAYNTFNMVNFRFFSANINYSGTTHKIVNSIDQLPKKYANPTDTSLVGKTITIPVNLNGAFNSSAFITMGFPFRNPKLKGSSVNATTMASYNKDVSLFYKQVNFNTLLSATQSVGVNYNYKEKIDLGLRGSLSYNDARYERQPSSNTKYWSQTYSAEINLTLPKNFILNTDFDYYINTGRAEGYNQSIPMLNAFISKLVFKNKAGEIRLSARDILNQNQSLTRNTGENYYEDVRTNVLPRYFLLSFTYSLNRMGGKNMMQNNQQRQFGGRGRPMEMRND